MECKYSVHSRLYFEIFCKLALKPILRYKYCKSKAIDLPCLISKKLYVVLDFLPMIPLWVNQFVKDVYFDCVYS